MFVDREHLRACVRHGVTSRRGSAYRLTVRRLRALVVSAILFGYARLALIVFGACDELFFRGYRSVTPRKPVFVIGNFRSGTTLFLNMLNANPAATTAFRTWEIYLAPTVSQRKLLRSLKALDRLVGSPLLRIVRRFNERILRAMPIHPIDLFAPEEDAGILLHGWTGFFTWFLFPDAERCSPFVTADDLPRWRRDRIARFYASFVRRHLFVNDRRGERVFVSKNPAFTGSIDMIRSVFPDARFVALTRDADATLRSGLEWFGVWARMLGDGRAAAPPIDPILDTIEHWYRYPVARLAADPPGMSAFVAYDDLNRDPSAVLRYLADELGFDWLHGDAALERHLAVRAVQFGTRRGRAARLAHLIRPEHVVRLARSTLAPSSSAHHFILRRETS